MKIRKSFIFSFYFRVCHEENIGIFQFFPHQNSLRHTYTRSQAIFFYRSRLYAASDLVKNVAQLATSWNFEQINYIIIIKGPFFCQWVTCLKFNTIKWVWTTLHLIITVIRPYWKDLIIVFICQPLWHYCWPGKKHNVTFSILWNKLWM